MDASIHDLFINISHIKVPSITASNDELKTYAIEILDLLEDYTDVPSVKNFLLKWDRTHIKNWINVFRRSFIRSVNQEIYSEKYDFFIDLNVCIYYGKPIIQFDRKFYFREMFYKDIDLLLSLPDKINKTNIVLFIKDYVNEFPILHKYLEDSVEYDEKSLDELRYQLRCIKIDVSYIDEESMN